MHREPYSQRLKEIRQKYGSTVQDTTSCLRSNDRQLFRNQSKYDDKCGLTKRRVQNTTFDKRQIQNVDPAPASFSSKYNNLMSKENEASKNFDSFLNTQNRDQRLKQIEKIRQDVAQSRRKAMDDWTRQAERSRTKYPQAQKYGGLRQRTNTNIVSNPEDYNFTSFKEVPSKQNFRNRAQSYISARVEPDLQINRELRRNYDYQTVNIKQDRELKSRRIQQTIPSSFRNASVSRFDRQVPVSTQKHNFAYTSSEFKNARLNDSQTTSPIRGLMKFDSLEKNRRAEVLETHHSVAKFSHPNYNLTNIDKIQERIQKILGKK